MEIQEYKTLQRKWWDLMNSGSARKDHEALSLKVNCTIKGKRKDTKLPNLFLARSILRKKIVKISSWRREKCVAKFRKKMSPGFSKRLGLLQLKKKLWGYATGLLRAFEGFCRNCTHYNIDQNKNKDGHLFLYLLYFTEN